MTVTAQRHVDVSWVTLATLMLAVFTVSIGYGVVLPLLPYLVERLLGAGVDVAQVSRHTGLLTAVYTLGLFLFAPMWGRLSDRRGSRGVLLIGLLGFGATMLVFSFVENLAAVYAERFLSGLFAAAVTPVAAAVIGGFTATEQARARRLAFVSIAGITGFLLGPMLSVFITRFAASYLFFTRPAGSIAVPLAATAAFAFLVSICVVFAVPRGRGGEASKRESIASVEGIAWLVPKLLILTFIVSAGVGAFEVGLALRGKQELGLTPYQIALMFSECSLVMFVMQSVVFSSWFKPEKTRWLIAPSLAGLAAGLFLVPWASDFSWMLVVIGAVAASAGILSPILTYWISAKAGSAQGWQLGKQTAAASLGVTLGSAAGGLLFNITSLPGASFILTAGLAIVGLLLSLKLPSLLVSRDLGAGQSEANCCDPDSNCATALHKTVAQICDATTTLTLFIEGDDLFDAMLADLALAQSAIRIESYIFADDEIGSQFIDVLGRAARSGIATTLRLDAAGSWGGLRRSSVAKLAQDGVVLGWSRAWSWRHPWSFHLRNHRKLLIVDDRVAYLGGFNIHRDSSRRVVGEGRWRDTHVRISGRLVRDATAVFDRYLHLGRAWQPRNAHGIYLLPNRTAHCRHRLRCAFNDRFSAARERVWLTTPYFVPDWRSQRRLCAAAQRGVDVRLLVPGKNDVAIAQWASRAAYARMLVAGVRIFEYQSRVLHAKTALVDRDWGTVGTANFDYRSFFVNDELNLIAEDAAFNANLAAQFELDLANSREVTAESWRHRHWRAPIAEAIGWWARRWL